MPIAPEAFRLIAYLSGYEPRPGQSILENFPPDTAFVCAVAPSATARLW